jgi:hypothetical protein
MAYIRIPFKSAKKASAFARHLKQEHPKYSKKLKLFKKGR